MVQFEHVSLIVIILCDVNSCLGWFWRWGCLLCYLFGVILCDTLLWTGLLDNWCCLSMVVTLAYALEALSGFFKYCGHRCVISCVSLMNVTF